MGYTVIFVLPIYYYVCIYRKRVAPDRKVSGNHYVAKRQLHAAEIGHDNQNEHIYNRSFTNGHISIIAIDTGCRSFVAASLAHARDQR